MDTDELVRTLKRLRPALEAEGVSRLVVFGSRATGTAGPQSDLDIAIDVVPEAGFSILDLIGVEHLLTDATGISANAFMLRSLDAPFRAEVDRKGIAVF